MPRPSKGAEAKRHIVTMRMSDASRQRIATAAADSGRSVTQEIESRLERSFDRDDALGAPRTTTVLRLIAATIGDIEAASGKSWLEDYVSWHAVRVAVDDVLKRARPDVPNQDAIIEAAAKVDALRATGDYIDRAAAETTVSKLIEVGGGGPPTTPEYLAALHAAAEAIAPIAEAQRRGQEIAASIRKED